MPSNALMLAQEALNRARIETEPRQKAMWLEIAEAWAAEAKKRSAGERPSDVVAQPRMKRSRRSGL